jgi:hypothetical protein
LTKAQIVDKRVEFSVPISMKIVTSIALKLEDFEVMKYYWKIAKFMVHGIKFVAHGI